MPNDISNENTASSRPLLISSIVGVGLIAIIVIMMFAQNQSQSTSSPTTAPPESEVSSMTSSPDTSSSNYQNGQFEATGHYTSPGGPETIQVSLTLENGVVTDATVEPQAELPTSQQFQSIFTNNYKEYVVGQNIADLKLDKVSGSSLTPKGFNDAVEQIKAEAKVS